MIVVFDLDETLYDERTYVKSGFRVVSEFLEKDTGIPGQEILDYLNHRFDEYGRKRIFNLTLHHFGIYTKTRVRKCVTTYRFHLPDIKLYPEAIACLERLQNHALYIVTDGNKIVQGNKIEALGVKDYVKHAFVTHRYGLKNSKPSPHCFLRICKREKCFPDRIVYVGDNPYKDFLGIKPLGFHTIRVMKGAHKAAELEEYYEAVHRIDSLDELTDEWLERLLVTESLRDSAHQLHK